MYQVKIVIFANQHYSTNAFNRVSPCIWPRKNIWAWRSGVFFNSACVFHSILLLVVSSLAVYSIHLLLLLCDKTGNINSHSWPLLYPTHWLLCILCDYNSSHALHQVKNLCWLTVELLISNWNGLFRLYIVTDTRPHYCICLCVLGINSYEALGEKAFNRPGKVG